jgi:SAM-dependent methyltransferase
LTSLDHRSRLYEHYASWKSWDGGSAEGRPYAHEQFEQELARFSLPADASILEVGFGAGWFLDWAKDRGFRVVGTEINPALVDSAAERGHTAMLGHPRDLTGCADARFDLVVLFDVLEHLTPNEIIEMFEAIAAMLTPEGKVLARFPNGVSPFGRYRQYGDATHVTVLSGATVHQLATVAGLSLLGEFNAARNRLAGGGAGALKKRLAYWLRDILQPLIGYTYFGRNVPLDPVMTVVVGRRDLRALDG